MSAHPLLAARQALDAHAVLQQPTGTHEPGSVLLAECDRLTARCRELIAEADQQRAEAARLHAALADARDGLQEMLPYVWDYFREKWELDGYLKRAEDALQPAPRLFEMFVRFRNPRVGGIWKIIAPTAELAATTIFRDHVHELPLGSIREIVVSSNPAFAVVFLVTPFGLCRIEEHFTPPPPPPLAEYWLERHP